MMVYPQCLSCRNYDKDFTCKAYPDAIPTEILRNEKDHRESLEGDNGILYEYLGEEKETTEKAMDPLVNFNGSHEEYCDSLFSKEFASGNKSYLIQALLHLVAPEFSTLAPDEVESMYDSVISTMLNPRGWNIKRITDKLKNQFVGLTDIEAERIARTETSRIANKARELEFKERHPEGRYIWIGPQDHRTTKICETIKSEQPNEGLRLDELKILVNDVSTRFGMVPYDWTPHINCRHTFRRVT